MKKQLLLLALLCLGSLAFAQKTQTGKKQFTHRIPETLSNAGAYGIDLPWALPCEETYSYYYDESDNKIKHGPSKIEGKYKTNNGIAIDEKFSGTAYYVNGLLSGIVKQKYSILITDPGEFLEIRWSFDGSYVEGLPDGSWIFSEVYRSKHRGQKESPAVKINNTVIFNHGMIKSITYSDGNKNQFDENGNVSGKYGDFIVKNGVLTNFYKRKNGEFCVVDSEQTGLINKYLSGDYKDQYFVDRGYAFSHYSDPDDVDILGLFLSRVGNSHYVDLEYLGGSIDPKFNNYLVVLNKVEVKTFDEVKWYITNNNGEIVTKRYDEVNNNEWGYVSTEVKSQIDSYVIERNEASRQKCITAITSCSNLKELGDIQESMMKKDSFSKEDVAMLDSICEKKKQELIPITEQGIINKIKVATSSEELKFYYSNEQKVIMMIPNKQLIESTYQTKYNELQTQEERIAKRENRRKKIKTTVETVVGVVVIVGGYLGYRYLFKGSIF